MRTLGVLLAALALVGVASAARTATVTVRDASLAPARVRIDAGGTVTWRNAGARSHRIASSTRAFAAFSLAPGARKAVRFTRNGAHRYTVDGRRCGVVYVGVPLGPGCSVGGGGTAPPPPAGTKIYAYNVVFRGSFKDEGYVDDSTGRREETWMNEYTWNATFTNFKFKVAGGGGRFIGANATAALFASTARVTQRWDWLVQAQTQGPPNNDCEGASTGVFRSVLGASASNFSKNFYVAWQVPTFSEIEAFSGIGADCDGIPRSTPQTPFTLADGTRVGFSDTTLLLEFERETGGLRNPAGALLNGRSFTIDTRVKVSEKPSCEGCSGSGKVTITERYVAVFTRRP